jgi:hypothetical protein
MPCPHVYACVVVMWPRSCPSVTWSVRNLGSQLVRSSGPGGHAPSFRAQYVPPLPFIRTYEHTTLCRKPPNRPVHPSCLTSPLPRPAPAASTYPQGTQARQPAPDASLHRSDGFQRGCRPPIGRSAAMHMYSVLRPAGRSYAAAATAIHRNLSRWQTAHYRNTDLCRNCARHAHTCIGERPTSRRGSLPHEARPLAAAACIPAPCRPARCQPDPRGIHSPYGTVQMALLDPPAPSSPGPPRTALAAAKRRRPG